MVKNKRNISFMIFIGLLLLAGCSIPPIDCPIENYIPNIKDSCMFGCIAGLHYNGTAFITADIDDNSTYDAVGACDTFCKIALREGII